MELILLLILQLLGKWKWELKNKKQFVESNKSTMPKMNNI